MNLWVGDGYLSFDPSIKYIQSGAATCRFRLKIPRESKKGSDSKRVYDFIDVVTWGTLAETCANSFKKGDFVSVRGRIKVWKKTPQNGGAEQKVFDVEANTVLYSISEKEDDQENNPSVSPEVAGMGSVIPDDSIPF